LEADLLLHIEDIANPDFKKQREAVFQVLKELEVNFQEKMLTVFNKIDLLTPEQEGALQEQAKRSLNQFCVSAIKGKGSETLLKAIDDTLRQEDELLNLKIPVDKGALLAWLYHNAQVLERFETEEEITLTIKISQKSKQRLKSSFNFLI